MIPIIFNSTETAFTSQGLGRLIDARKCLVTEERNGSYELVLEYPTNGPLFDKLTPGNYILATHDDNGDEQPFEIYETSAPIDGWLKVYAWHISYKLNRIVVAPFIASGISAALSGLSTNSMNTNPFTFWTNKTTAGTFGPNKPATVRALLGGTSGSILDTFGGGEYEFDKFDVKLWTARGANRGVTIRYGKNLKELNYELDASNVYNAVVPFWQNNTQTVYSNNVIVKTGQTAKGVIPLDLSTSFMSAPTTAQLESAAQAYIDASASYVLKDNITLDFVPLWQTEEYKLYQAVERVKLCDTVEIVYEKFGINATAKVIKVVYDTLLDRYASVELGVPKTTLSQQIAKDVVSQVLPEVSETVARSTIDAANISGSLDGVDINGAKFSTVLISSGASKTFNVPNGSRHLMIVSGTVEARMAAYIIGCATNGTVDVYQIVQGASISRTISTRSITLTPSGGSASVLIITFSGEKMTF